MKHSYFDWAATTKTSEKALQTFNEVTQRFWHNPSGSYSDSEAASAFLKEQRIMTAELLNVDFQEIIYTSGATEANALILNSLLWKKIKKEVLFNSLEHDSILQHSQFLRHCGFSVTDLKINKGYFELDKLRRKLSSETQLVTLLLVSNIFGTVQDVENCSKLIREFEKQSDTEIHFHCDATQAIGKTEFNLKELGIDSATFSAHKFQGPKGVGFLYLKNRNIKNLSSGGGQEMGFRGGTENIASIAAMNVALQESLSEFKSNNTKAFLLRGILERNLKTIPSVTFLSPSINDSSKKVVPQIFCFSVNNIPSEVLVRLMDDRGFALSSASACSANASFKKSRVYLESGFSATQASGAIRVSFGPSTTESEIINLTSAIGQEVSKQTTLLRRK